jgi:cysteine-rich repeat protein
MRRPCAPLAVLIASAPLGCGPLVQLDDAVDTGVAASSGGVDSSSDGGQTTVPPNPSVDPDPTIASTDPSDTGVDPSTTGTPADPDCGNGELDGDPGKEECDDGNQEDGDACSAQCTVTRDVLWTVTHDGGASSFDRAADVVLGPDDSVWVVGTTRNIGTHDDVWLQQYLPDGTPGVGVQWDAGLGLADVGLAIAWTPDGRLVVVGSTESATTGDDLLVLQIDPATAAVLSAYVLDGPGSGPGEFDDVDTANAIAIDASGVMRIAATMRVGPGDSDVLLAAFDADGGPPMWTNFVQGGPGERDAARAILEVPEGWAMLAAFDAEHTAQTLIFDDGGELQWSLDGGWLPDDIAMRSDGSVALVGMDGPDDSAEILVQIQDPQWGELWTATIVTPGNHDGAGLGVAVGPDDEVVAVGALGVPDHQDDALVRAYRADGTPWWGDAYDNAGASLKDQFEAVVVDGVGDVIAVGSETVLGQQTNVLVRKYRPR